MIFVDGAKWPPTYPGTGHEETFNAGCCPDEEFWGFYTGFYLIENLTGNFGGKNQMYRFYVNDPVRFKKSIRVMIEHGHANNFENDYTSTAFWYQKEPHKAFPPMPTKQPAKGAEDASPVDAQVQAGHSRLDMTREYTVITERKRVRAVKRLQKKLLPKGTDWSPEGGFA